MFTNFKLNRQIRRVKKNMSSREKAIFDFLYERPNGVTKSTLEKALGYKMSGWVISSFNEYGVSIKMKNKRYYIDEIFG